MVKEFWFNLPVKDLVHDKNQNTLKCQSERSRRHWKYRF